MNKLNEMINPNLNSEFKEGPMEMVGLMGEFTLETSLIDQEVLDLIYGTQEPIEEQEFTMQFDVSYQARRHRKKRINKKWLKRYGLKHQTITSEGWSLISNEENSLVEMIREKKDE